jgi:hypothetical protein
MARLPGRSARRVPPCRVCHLQRSPLRSIRADVLPPRARRENQPPGTTRAELHVAPGDTQPAVRSRSGGHCENAMTVPGTGCQHLQWMASTQQPRCRRGVLRIRGAGTGTCKGMPPAGRHPPTPDAAEAREELMQKTLDLPAMNGYSAGACSCSAGRQAHARTVTIVCGEIPACDTRCNETGPALARGLGAGVDACRASTVVAAGSRDAALSLAGAGDRPHDAMPDQHLTRGMP